MVEVRHRRIKEAESDSVDMEPAAMESPTIRMEALDSGSRQAARHTTPMEAANQAGVIRRSEADKATAATAMCQHPWDRKVQASHK